MSLKRVTLLIILLSLLSIALVASAPVRSALDRATWNCCHLTLLPVPITKNNSDLFFEMGNYYFGGGAYDLGRAAKNFATLLALNPEGYPGLEYQLARIAFVRGDLFNALIHIDKEITQYPDFKRSYYVRGLIYAYMDNLPAAAADFISFLEWKPASWAGHNDLSWVYFREGNFKKAAEAARNGLKDNPKNPWLSNSLGTALMNLGDYKEAEIYLLDAEEGFARITPGEWGNAYPGNDPRIYAEGFAATKETVAKNIALVRQKMKESE